MKLAQYIRETRGELKHVNWPTRSQAINYTIIVIAISLLTALFLGLADFLFSRIITLIIK